MPVYRLEATIHQLPTIHLRFLGRCRLAAGEWRMERAVDLRWSFYWNCQEGAWVQPIGLDRRIPLPARQLVIIPARCAFTSACEQDLDHFFGHFDIDDAADLDHRLSLLPQVLPQDPTADAPFHRWEGLSGTPGLELHLALTGRLLGAIASVMAPAPEAPEDPVLRRQLQPALDRIRWNYPENLGHGDLAAACGMTVPTFTRKYRALTGTTAMRALRRRRVERAARLVVDTDQDLDAIARLCGLGNASYLIRMFRSVLGTTPGAYRRGLPSRLLAGTS